MGAKTMETLWHDLRYGWRTLRRNPGFAFVAILTLAIGIGANAAIFTVIDAILIRPLPFFQSSRLVMVWDTDANRSIKRGTVSLAEFLDWQDMNHVFQSMSGLLPSVVTLNGDGEPEQPYGVQVSANFFRMLGVKPILGRDFSPEEEVLGHEQVTMLSYAMWQRRYGGDPQILGRSIQVDHKPYKVIGVLPRNFSIFGTSVSLDLWFPFAFNRAQLDRNTHGLIIFARLVDSVSIPQAQAEMETIIASVKKQNPTIDQKNGVKVASFHAELGAKVKPALLVLLAVVGLVLLIACANVANLMLARAASREHEIVLRAALGAGYRRIVRQLLTESVLLALIGGVFGILVAFGMLHILHAALPPAGSSVEIPNSEGIGMDGTVLIFTLGVSLVTGIIFGLAPAIQITRSSLSESLKEGGRGSTGGRRGQRARSGLIISEIALSVILLTGAGLLLRSFVLLLSQDLGFNPSRVLTLQITLPESHYSADAKVVSFFQRVTDQVAALPGVKAASAVNFLPLSKWTDFCNFDIAGRPIQPSGDEFNSEYRVVDWRYLHAMDTPLKEGRDLAESDGPNTPPVALINEELAHRYWPNEDPVGQQLRIHVSESRSPWEADLRGGWLTIAGVVVNTRETDPSGQQIGLIYLPYTQNPSQLMHLVVRSNGDFASLTTQVRHVVEGVDPEQPVTEVRTVENFLSAILALRRLSMLLALIFAGVATVLAAVGIYGVMAYSVTQRSHEIGIRMALGAYPADVMRMVVGDGMRLAGAGLAIGLMASLVAMRYLQSQLFGVQSTDLITFCCVPAALALVALGACYIPARRATRVDPLDALRHQ
jgi:putative ABC transport system permease protein